MDHFYAQIRDGVVVAITQSDRPIEGAHMVEIETFDQTLMGATYEGGEFTRVEPPAP